jgi:hypothetical protein
MLIGTRSLPPIDSPQAIGGHRWKQESDQHPGDAYVCALRDEEAYLQTDEDEKPEILAEPPPDPAWFKCSFCRRTDRRVLFGGEYPVRDRSTFAVIALIFICDKCVANFAESLGQERPKAPPTKSVAGRHPPCRARPATAVLGREGPERRRCPRPDRTGASVAQWCWSVLGPHGIGNRRFWLGTSGHDR